MENAGEQEREHGLCKGPRVSAPLGEPRRGWGKGALGERSMLGSSPQPLSGYLVGIEPAAAGGRGCASGLCIAAAASL